MRLQVLSDLHTEFGEPLPPVVPDADVIVLAGDIATAKQDIIPELVAWTDKPVIYVLGNHDYYHGGYPSMQTRRWSEARGTNVHVLENASVEIGGVRFLGCTLWTDFRLLGDEHYVRSIRLAQKNMNDYECIRHDEGRGLYPFDTYEAHARSRDWLETEFGFGFEGKTAVVTHHGPTPKSVHPKFRDDWLNPCYVSDLTPLMGKMDLWVHGHTHAKIAYTVRGTRVVTNPRGYPGEGVKGFDPAFVVEV